MDTKAHWPINNILPLKPSNQISFYQNDEQHSLNPAASTRTRKNVAEHFFKLFNHVSTIMKTFIKLSKKPSSVYVHVCMSVRVFSHVSHVLACVRRCLECVWQSRHPMCIVEIHTRPCWANMVTCCAQLKRKWNHLGPSWPTRQFGSRYGSIWAHWAYYLYTLGPCWAHSGWLGLGQGRYWK